MCKYLAMCKYQISQRKQQNRSDLFFFIVRPDGNLCEKQRVPILKTQTKFSIAAKYKLKIISIITNIELCL